MAISTRAAKDTMVSINPATGQSIGRFPHTPPAEVDRALDAARAAFLDWRQASFKERARPLRAAAAHLRANAPRLARLITEEMGKPIAEAEAEIVKCAVCCDFYAERAAEFLADQPHPSPAAAESYVAFDPLGVVLAAMPWNFPFWQVFRFAAPALMAGNTALLKHASNVPRCALAIEEVFRQSGFPPGAFRTLLIPGGATDDLIADARIAAVTVTGSVETGVKVGAAAGAALKKVVLELGGSDPFIVLADADLDAAVATGIRARFRNAGQSCIAAKRFLVEDAVFDAFVGRFVAEARALRVGDPLDRAMQMGPLARADLRDALHGQVQDTVRQGARVVLGGRPLPGPGFFYEPTVLADLTPTMRAFKEETFGPVAAFVRVRDADEAIRLANQTQFGLGSSIWTRDVERAKRLARLIEAGQVFINDIVASDPHVPFGGVKSSGHGRELSEFGIREFTNVKTVWIGKGASEPSAGATTE